MVFFNQCRNLIKIEPFDDKNVAIFSCCSIRRKTFKIVPVEDIKEMINNHTLEKFLNGLFNEISCDKGFGACEPLNKFTEFSGIQNSLYTECNSNCYFCWAKYPNKELGKINGYNFNNLYFKLLRELLRNDIYSEIRLTDRGEPLLDDRTKTFLESIPENSKLKKINITTNGFLLNEYFDIFKNKKNIKFRILISVPSPDSKSYKEITGRDFFNTVYNNISEIAKIPNIEFGISFLLSERLINYYNKNNLNIKDGFKKFLKGLNNSNFIFRFVLVNGIEETEEIKELRAEYPSSFF